MYITTSHHHEDKNSLICFDCELSEKKYWCLSLKFDKQLDELADNSQYFIVTFYLIFHRAQKSQLLRKYVIN